MTNREDNAAEAILRAEELQLEAIGRIVAAPKCEAGGCDRQAMPNDSMCGLCGFIRDDARRTFFGAVRAGFGL